MTLSITSVAINLEIDSKYSKNMYMIYLAKSQKNGKTSIIITKF